MFSTYKRYKHTQEAKDAESLIIPQREYENSEFIKGQQVSISERSRRYSPKDFEYTIRTEDGSEEPISDPDEFVEFSDEDKARMAQTIITELPQLDTEHLKEVYNTLTNNLSNGNNRRK